MSESPMEVLLSQLPRWMRSGPMAELLGVSTMTLRLWEAKGIVPPAVRAAAGGNRRWPVREVLEAIEKNRPAGFGARHRPDAQPSRPRRKGA